MPPDEHNQVECAVLRERIVVQERRIDALEIALRSLQTSSTELLVELKVLQTRVSLYAAAIAFGVSLVVKFVV